MSSGLARAVHRDICRNMERQASNGSPVIGDGITLGAGAKILGPIEVGAASAIGANSVMTTSIPPSSIAAGVPARVLRSTADRSEQRRG